MTTPLPSGVEAGWLAESPADGTLPAHAERAVTLTLDTGQVQPGEHRLRLLAVSDDPQYPQVYLPLTVTVLPAPTMGRLTGFVTGVCRQGIAARVAARDFPATVAAPGTGHYTLWLDEGEHEVRAALASGDRFISHTVAVHITAQGTTVQDFGLPWCGLYLPLTLRGM
ncbi:MAG TPA: hypothetical protein ENK17_05440 [Anaerolineae bacterium]|nr:hypothetical protein [Anaerolineae bacterium]